MPHHLQIDIGLLLLEGLWPMHALRVRQVLERELDRLLAQPETQGHLARHGRQPITLAQVELARRHGVLPEEIGAQLAQSVYQQIMHSQGKPDGK